jgi:hypothetical protein
MSARAFAGSCPGSAQACDGRYDGAGATEKARDFLDFRPAPKGAA